MITYKNLSGDSGVIAYHPIDDGIEVRFRNGDTYVYTTTATGVEEIREMLRLAQAGKGLSTYISRYVRDRYAFKY